MQLILKIERFLPCSHSLFSCQVYADTSIYFYRHSWVFKFTSGNIAARNVLSSCYHSVLYNVLTDEMNHLSPALSFFSKSSTAHSKGTAHEEHQELADVFERQTETGRPIGRWKLNSDYLHIPEQKENNTLNKLFTENILAQYYY